MELLSLLPLATREDSDMVQSIHQKSDMELPDHVPPIIQAVVQKFIGLFQTPTQLPPSRPFDHKIPLIPGAQPVNVTPYKYAPQQKSEIEKQVIEML